MHSHGIVVGAGMAIFVAAAVGACGGTATPTDPPTGLVYSTNPAAYEVGTAITPNVPTYSGGASIYFFVSPQLPSGLILNHATGVIEGTPTVATPTKNYTVTANNPYGFSSAIISMTVRGVSIAAICTPPTPDSTNGSCLYPATCEHVLAGWPMLDILTAQIDFRLPVQIENSFLDNSGGGRINTNNALIQSFEMTYEGTGLQPWSVAASVSVPTSGSSGVVLRLIPVAYFPALLPVGIATFTIGMLVRAHGVLGSQDSFATPWFQVPVMVCSGCLASSFTCTPPSVLVTCPPAATVGAQPGQTATPACATLQ
jgi:hypothetical protein